MGGVTINDQKNHAVNSMKKSLDKLDKLGRSDPSFNGHKTEFPLATNRRDQIQSKPGSRTANHRSFPFAPHVVPA